MLSRELGPHLLGLPCISHATDDGAHGMRLDHVLVDPVGGLRGLVEESPIPIPIVGRHQLPWRDEVGQLGRLEGVVGDAVIARKGPLSSSQLRISQWQVACLARSSQSP